MTRIVAWGGLTDARDLGGLPVDDERTKFWSFYRSARLDDLAEEGWQQLVDAGVRTVVDLRNLDEVEPVVFPADSVTYVHPMDDRTDDEFMRLWSRLMNSPVYYADSLNRFPENVARVFAVFAEAPEGGVLFHCGGGQDRTGLIAAMLLRLVGVADVVIADDYEISARAMNDVYRADPSPLEPAKTDEELESWIAETRENLLRFLADLDVEIFLVTNGVTEEQIDRIKVRLLR